MVILQARILEWVAMPSFMGSSQPRDQTQVSHNADGFFIIWATRKVPEYCIAYPFSRGSFWPQNQNGVFCIVKADSLPAELQGSPFFVSTSSYFQITSSLAHFTSKDKDMSLCIQFHYHWTVKKAEGWIIDAFELWCWRRLLRVPWTARRSNQSILKIIP